MIGKVGEDLEKDLERKLENCATQVSVNQSSGSEVLTSTRLNSRDSSLHRMRLRNHCGLPTFKLWWHCYRGGRVNEFREQGWWEGGRPGEQVEVPVKDSPKAQQGGHIFIAGTMSLTLWHHVRTVYASHMKENSVNAVLVFD